MSNELIHYQPPVLSGRAFGAQEIALNERAMSKMCGLVRDGVYEVVGLRTLYAIDRDNTDMIENIAGVAFAVRIRPFLDGLKQQEAKIAYDCGETVPLGAGQVKHFRASDFMETYGHEEQVKDILIRDSIRRAEYIGDFEILDVFAQEDKFGRERHRVYSYIQCRGYDLAGTENMADFTEDAGLSNSPELSDQKLFFTIRVPSFETAHCVVDVERLIQGRREEIKQIFYCYLEHPEAEAPIALMPPKIITSVDK